MSTGSTLALATCRPLPYNSPSNKFRHSHGPGEIPVTIDTKLIEHIALLARLKLPPEEKERLEHDLIDIVAYVEELNEVDIEGVPPTSRALPQKNVFITEAADARLAGNEVIQNAPDRQRDHFKVPRIIDEQ
jgi:aspartyl-tRNA(Asn)/glutamyl-tRNA(Gln) amidotransferase subunit C